MLQVENYWTTAMGIATKLFQPFALVALLAAQSHGVLDMPGVRQALRMIAGQSVSIAHTFTVPLATAGSPGAGSLASC